MDAVPPPRNGEEYHVFINTVKSSLNNDPDLPDVHRNMGVGSLNTTSHHDTYDFIKPLQFELTSKVAGSGDSYGIGRTIAVSLT
jgi:hypothetical protein